MSDAYNALNNAAFNSYDPEQDMYDPSFDNATGPMPIPAPRSAGSVVRRSPRQPMATAARPQANYTIQITSTEGDGFTGGKIELFNSMYGIYKIASGDFPNYKPLMAVGQTPKVIADTGGTPSTYNLFVYGYTANGGAPLTDTLVYWDLNGSLVFNFPNGTITISCKEIPYRALVEYSGSNSFSILNTRMKVTNNNQFSNDLVLTYKTFLGAVNRNTVSPNNYFGPDQFQSQLIDMPVTIKIDKERGIQMFVNPGETITMVMSVGGWTKAAF